MIRIRNKLTSTCDKPTRDFNSKTSGNKKRAEAPIVEGGRWPGEMQLKM